MPRMPRTRPSALVATALTCAVLTACASTPEEPGTAPGPAPAGDGGLPVVPADVGHVHGLAVNPADGQLYLGTHGGLLVVDDGSVTRVGDHTIDLMGFTAAGPDHFYASGHPGPKDDLPNPVGLIETTDGGETWEPLSLGGEADFHTLGAAGEQVYGFAGQLVGSADGQEWTAGADDVAPASLAVDPQDGDRVVATTENGPLLSTDGGQSWSEQGSVEAQPTAFTAGQDGAVVVVTDSAILRSTDQAKTFEPVAELAGDH